MIKFKLDTVIYGSAKTGTAVFRDDKTLGYCFINTGNCSIQLNNFLLQPNTTYKTFETGCKDNTTYRMVFNTFDACSAGNAELTVVIYNLDI
jgi:hypothetical protein